MKKNQLTPATGLILGLMLGGSLTYFMAYPTYQASNEAKARGDALQVELTRQQALAQQLQTLQSANAEKELALMNFNIRFPKQERFSAMLQRLQNEAAVYNVTLGDLRRTIEASDIPGVDTLRLEIKITGTYPNVRAFIRSLDEGTRFASIDNLKLNLNKEKSVLDVNMSVNSYLLRNATAQAPAPAAPTKETP